jgi:hypothetical protein
MDLTLDREPIHSPPDVHVCFMRTQRGNGGTPTSKFGDTGSFFVGQSIHMVDGVVLTILFVALIHGRIPLPNTNVGNLLKGLIYGTVLAIISAGFLVPYVYAPKSGFGVFSFDTPDGWKLPASILLFHWTYGYLVGTLYHGPDAKKTA